MATGAHAVLVCDGADWRQPGDLRESSIQEWEILIPNAEAPRSPSKLRIAALRGEGGSARRFARLRS